MRLCLSSCSARWSRHLRKTRRGCRWSAYCGSTRPPMWDPLVIRDALKALGYVDCKKPPPRLPARGGRPRTAAGVDGGAGPREGERHLCLRPSRGARSSARTIPIIAVGSDWPCGHGPAKVSMVYPRRCCSASTKSSVCSCWQIGSSGSASGGKWPLPAALRVTASRHCSSTVRALVDFQRDRIRCFSTCRIRCCGARNSLIRERNSIASPDHNSIPKILKNNISGAAAGPVSGARA